MKKTFSVSLIWSLFFTLSCNNAGIRKSPEDKVIETSKPDVHFNTKPQDILTDYMTWYTYTYNNIKLAQDFIALDADSVLINKNLFLSQLLTGNYIPIKIMIREDLPVYRLYKYDIHNSDILSTLKQSVLYEISYIKMEGKEFPKFNFEDLKDNIYNNSNTKGKIVVVKCWFIHCVACVEEFPEVNKLVDDYKQRKDMLFVSLATDSKKDLISFLNKKELKYAVVPGAGKFMSQDLGIMAYPTHIVVGKDGKIMKVVDTAEDLIAFLKKET